MSDPFSEDLRYNYPLTPESVVIDLGCFKGDFAARIHEKYGCRVFAFEPVAHFFERCHNRFKDTPGVRVIPAAVGGENGTVHGVEKGDMSGLYVGGEPNWSSGMMTMDSALQKLSLEGADLLKINIEGSEFQLLEDMYERGLIPRFANIQVQWHDVVTGAARRYSQLQEQLGETHSLTFDHGWVWQNWRLK